MSRLSTFQRTPQDGVARELTDCEQLQNMYQQGIIGKRFLGTDYTKNTCNGQLQPKLNIVAETSRRDVWVATVKEQIEYYFDVFDYAKL